LEDPRGGRRERSAEVHRDRSCKDVFEGAEAPPEPLKAGPAQPTPCSV